MAEVQHLFCQSRPMDKDRVLVRLLETENPASAIIFCNTKANVHYITGVLQGFGYNADELSADLSQARREAVLDKIRQGSLQYLCLLYTSMSAFFTVAKKSYFLFKPSLCPKMTSSSQSRAKSSVASSDSMTAFWRSSVISTRRKMPIFSMSSRNLSSW